MDEATERRRDRRRETRQEWRRANPERWAATQKRAATRRRENGRQLEADLLRLYGLSIDDYRQMISGSYRESELLQVAKSEGMRTLIEDGLEKVRKGLTTLEELLRVLGPHTGTERSCDSCQRLIDAKFAFCPYCGAFKNNYCHTCKVPLEEDWLKCPYCGGHK